MKKPGKNELWQAASFLLCVGVAWTKMDDYGAPEFSGGRITGPVFTLFDDGMLVLMLAIPVTFIYRRVAAFAAIVGAALCLPLYLFATAPGPVRSIFKGE